MIQSLLILIFVLAYGIASAQDYVVTVSRDTIRGKVKYFNNTAVSPSSPNRKYVQVTTEQDEKKTFKVVQTLCFRMKDEMYHTVKFQNGYTFMKLVSGGYLNLYHYQLDEQTTWDGRYFLKKDGRGLDVPNINFKKKVSLYLSDCQTVAAKVETGDLSKTNLIKLVEQYNACIDTQSSPTPKSPSEEVWKDFELTVKALPDFTKKTDALEMIREIKLKLSRKEAVPSFLINGLKDALKDQSSIKNELEVAVENIN